MAYVASASFSVAPLRPAPADRLWLSTSEGGGISTYVNNVFPNSVFPRPRFVPKLSEGPQAQAIIRSTWRSCCDLRTTSSDALPISR